MRGNAQRDDRALGGSKVETQVQFFAVCGSKYTKLGPGRGRDCRFKAVFRFTLPFLLQFEDIGNKVAKITKLKSKYFRSKILAGKDP